MSNTNEVIEITRKLHSLGNDLFKIAKSEDDKDFALVILAGLEQLIKANNTILNHLKEVV